MRINLKTFNSLSLKKKFKITSKMEPWNKEPGSKLHEDPLTQHHQNIQLKRLLKGWWKKNGNPRNSCSKLMPQKNMFVGDIFWGRTFESASCWKPQHHTIQNSAKICYMTQHKLKNKDNKYKLRILKHFLLWIAALDTSGVKAHVYLPLYF